MEYYRNNDRAEFQKFYKLSSTDRAIKIIGKREFEHRLNIIKRAGQVGFIPIKVTELSSVNKVIDLVNITIRRTDSITLTESGQILAMLINLDSLESFKLIIDRLNVALSGHEGIEIKGIFLNHLMLTLPEIVLLLDNIKSSTVDQLDLSCMQCMQNKEVQCNKLDLDNKCQGILGRVRNKAHQINQETKTK